MKNRNSFEPQVFSNMDDSLLQCIGEDLSLRNMNERVVDRVTDATDEEFSNFRFLGIGKPTEKQKKKAEERKNKFTNFKESVKKKFTSIKDKVGKSGKKFRNKFRSILRKDILFKIKNNIHGTAVRMYPAVAPESEVKKRRFKKSYVDKSKKIYSDLVKRWISLGGNEAELKDAIMQGANKRRFLKTPKSFDGIVDSNALYSFYSLNDELYNNTDGEVEELPTEEEKKKGVRAFFAWFLGLFKRNNANENPYEEGTIEAKEFSQDENEDKSLQPSESEANNDVLAELDKTGKEDDAGGNTDATKKAEATGEEGQGDDEKKILGMSKKTFYVVAGFLAIGVIGFAVWKLRKK